jgi:RNA polymerase sigma-70 factor (ECF subfamily)
MNKNYLSWVEESRKGNREAFGNLMEQFQGMIYCFLYQKLHEYHLAQDLTQEVFVRAFQGIPRLRTPESFVSWLYRIARQVLAEYFRKQKTLVSLQEADYLQFQEQEKSPQNRELLAQLEISLSQLPLKYQTILSLKYFEKKSYQEISQLLGISLSTVDGRMTQAKHLLRIQMGFDYGL